MWGEELTKKRLRFVLSTWTHDVAVTREILAFAGAGAMADFIGVTGYLSVDKVDDKWMVKNVSAVFDALYQALPANIAKLQEHARVASSYGLQLITYEAGPGLVQDGVIGGGGANGYITELLIAVARNPRMEDFYTYALNQMRAAGVWNVTNPWMAFSSVGVFSKYGTWGHQEWTEQPLSQVRVRTLGVGVWLILVSNRLFLSLCIEAPEGHAFP